MALKEEIENQGNWLFRYRSILPVIILAIGLFVFTHTNLSKSIYENCTVHYELICQTISFIGVFIRVYTVGYTPRNTSGRNTKEGQVAETLNTTGLYSMVRHPLYLGNFFMWLGIAFYTGHTWFIVSFILFYWIYYERIMYAEEQFLERKFGTVYTEWAKKVPPFIPNLKLYKKPDMPFSSRKVLKKEKNGVFAIFLIFTFFDFVEEWIKSHCHINMFFLIGCIFTMLMYIVLKIMKMRKMKFLDDGR